MQAEKKPVELRAAGGLSRGVSRPSRCPERNSGEGLDERLGVRQEVEKMGQGRPAVFRRPWVRTQATVLLLL